MADKGCPGGGGGTASVAGGGTMSIGVGGTTAPGIVCKGTGPVAKPVPMKLFATWEVDKSSSNCIPRLCSLTLNRLIVLKPVDSEMQSVIIAVKMQNTKRVLRSNEIMMAPSGLLDTELDLSFSLQYPHFLKRDTNNLQVMLQRRKRYKNRTILGYKTLAVGQISMTLVMQQCADKELCLYSDLKETGSAVAKVFMLALSSQPVDHDEGGLHKLSTSEVDRSPDIDLSEDDDADEQEYSSNDEMSDSEVIAEEDDRPARLRSFLRGPMKPSITRQRNIKQKFVALLRRFKISEEVLDSEHDQEIMGDRDPNPQDIEDLFEELDNISDSEPDVDTISVLSTPKPKLRPFFTGRSSTENPDKTKDSGRLSDDSSKQNDSDSNLDSLTDTELSDSQMLSLSLAEHEEASGAGRRPRSPSASACIGSQSKTTNSMADKPLIPLQIKDRKMAVRTEHDAEDEQSIAESMAGNEPHKIILEQLGSIFQSEESLPESLTLVNGIDWQGQLLSQLLQDTQYPVICTCSTADVKATIAFIVNKIQKFCNTNSQAPAPVKVAIAGTDWYVNSVLRPYVEQFSAKAPEWQMYLKFLHIPLGGSALGNFLSSLDSTYSSIFSDSIWREAFEKSDSPSRPDMAEVVKRVYSYISRASHVVQLPIAEAMLTYKEKGPEVESSQTFVPFLNEVRIGPLEGLVGSSVSTSVDLEETSANAILSSSPPQTNYMDKTRDNHTPPNSPSIQHPTSLSMAGNPVACPLALSPPEVVDLQLDYWVVPAPRTEMLDKSERLQKKDSKSSLKTSFRSVQVNRLGVCQGTDMCTTAMSMTVVTKEKKQKIMRLGKKSRDAESKSQMMEGISRLVCTTKAQNSPLTVYIDSTEWQGVKFFQLSAQWQTYVKAFPVLIFSQATDVPQSC